MKIFTTSSPMMAMLFLFIIMFTSISCASQPADSLMKDSPKYLSFYENVNGERIHWEANFEGSEIKSIYKNGERIPDNLVDDYKDKIYDQLDEMRFTHDRFSFRMPDIHIDLDDLNKQMEKFKGKMEKLEKELQEKLRGLENYKFHFEIEEEDTEV